MISGTHSLTVTGKGGRSGSSIRLVVHRDAGLGEPQDAGLAGEAVLAEVRGAGVGPRSRPRPEQEGDTQPRQDRSRSQQDSQQRLGETGHAHAESCQEHEEPDEPERDLRPAAPRHRREYAHPRLGWAMIPRDPATVKRAPDG
jgi:hypothetical protein